MHTGTIVNWNQGTMWNKQKKQNKYDKRLKKTSEKKLSSESGFFSYFMHSSLMFI